MTQQKKIAALREWVFGKLTFIDLRALTATMMVPPVLPRTFAAFKKYQFFNFFMKFFMYDKL